MTYEECLQDAIKRFPQPSLRPPEAAPASAATMPHAVEQCGKADETEIEITPAMLRAGARVLSGFETMTADEFYWAEMVYRAMESARLIAILHQPQQSSR